MYFGRLVQELFPRHLERGGPRNKVVALSQWCVTARSKSTGDEVVALSQ